MLSFHHFGEARIPGKNMRALYVHKDYITQSAIPQDLFQRALAVLHEKHPKFNYTIVKYDGATQNVSFLHSPNWDSADEPLMDEGISVSPTGETKVRKSNTLYHQKWQMVGDDYEGFDVGKSKKRTELYQDAIRKLAKKKGVHPREYLSRIGNPEFWQREVVPYIRKE